MKTPKGGDRRPIFHSRQFCRSVCGRTKSFRRSRNVKGNCVWGSYGGFSAGSWRVVGTFSAESRHDLGEISPPLAMRSMIGEFEGFASRFLAQKLPKAPEKASRGRSNDPRMAKRWPEEGNNRPRGPPKPRTKRRFTSKPIREAPESANPRVFPPVWDAFWHNVGSQIR